MSKSIDTAQAMHDVPLWGGNENAGGQSDEPTTTAPKTNSLKRFFKMPTKRGTGSDSKLETETGQSEGTDKLPEAGSRFRLRLGSMGKHTAESQQGQPGNAAEEKSETKLPKSDKMNLKKSISNYWNSVFKRHHGGKGGEHIDDIDAALNAAADELAHIDEAAKGEPISESAASGGGNADDEAGAVGGAEKCMPGEEGTCANKINKCVTEITEEMKELTISDNDSN